jgi:hypothetical protein
MTDMTTARDPERQQRAAMRTVWVLAAIALALFAGTIWSFLR